MTLTAFLLVLVSVFLHAGWNFLSKSKRPSASFYMLSSGTSAVALLPFLWLADVPWGAMPPRFFGLLLASGLFEALYLFGLFRAYRACDISLAYPLARAAPVLMTAVATLALGLGEIPGPAALAGMAVVALGCLLMPLPSLAGFRLRNYCTPGIGMILLAALGTTGYTLVDSLAMPHVLDTGAGSRLVCAGVYLCLVEWLIVLFLGVYVATHAEERAQFRALFLKSPFPSISGLFSSAAYILILLAMGFVTNVSYIQAFRQMSLPLGVIAGIFLLKESRAPVKLAGIGLVVAGLVMVALNR